MGIFFFAKWTIKMGRREYKLHQSLFVYLGENQPLVSFPVGEALLLQQADSPALYLQRQVKERTADASSLHVITVQLEVDPC